MNIFSVDAMRAYLETKTIIISFIEKIGMRIKFHWFLSIYPIFYYEANLTNTFKIHVKTKLQQRNKSFFVLLLPKDKNLRPPARDCSACHWATEATAVNIIISVRILFSPQADCGVTYWEK